MYIKYRTYLTFAAKAIHLETKAPDEPSLVVIIPNLHELMNSDRSSIFSLMEVSSAFLALYGSAGLLPVSAFEKDMLVVYGLV